MLASVAWLNKLLDPADLSPDEAIDVLEKTSFPIESREDLPGGDVQIDVELTSNRGDAFSHLTLAREIAAATGRRAAAPASWAAASRDVPAVDAFAETTITVETPDACPRFTARLIRGVQVGPSPAWLRQALEAVGQRPINNVVDVSNYVLFELGHPSHTFDLATLAARRLIIRWARAGETLAALDGRTHELRPSDLVVADAQQAQSLAGVVGGVATGVTERTTDVLLEVATWDPITIRTAARRLQIATDAAYRFERTVDPRDLARASDRCAELILEVAGGSLEPGMIDAAAAAPAPLPVVELRPQRCRDILGVELTPEAMTEHLEKIGFGVERRGRPPHDLLACTVPAARVHDVAREIDVIEEVGRIHGIDRIEVAPALPVRFDFDHPPAWSRREGAMPEIGRVLGGLGFFETVTFSFAAHAEAAPFLPPGLRLIKVDEDRRKEAPHLRPSALPSLLTCRKSNHDAGVEQRGGVRLYEIAAVFAEHDDEGAHDRRTVENTNLTLLADLPQGGKGPERLQAGVRLVRGAVEALAAALGGPEATVDVRPMDAATPAYQGGVCAHVLINGEHAGLIGALPAAFTASWDLEAPVAVAEIGLDALIGLYPPEVRVEALPKFPAIERDLSLIVDEGVPWASIDALVAAAGLPHLEAAAFIGVYRGKQIGPGKKSVTLRLRFRDPDSTLRHEDVDGPVAAMVETVSSKLGAELRQ